MKFRCLSIFCFILSFIDVGLAKSSSQFSALHEELTVPPKEEGSLRLLTWNVQKKIQKPFLDQMIEDLKEIDADILLFQEAFQNLEQVEGNYQELLHEWETAITSIFSSGKASVHKVYPLSPQYKRNQCLAFITNQQVLSSEGHIFPEALQEKGWINTQFGFQSVLLNTRFGKFYVINVHLTPSGGGEKRKQQIETLFEYIHTHLDPLIPLIVSGDYNCLNFRQIVKNDQLHTILEQDIEREKSTPLFELEGFYREGFQEVYDILGVAAPWVTVWSLRRVDYIFVKNDQFFRLNPMVVKRVHSDHFPLLLDITTKKPEPVSKDQDD